MTDRERTARQSESNRWREPTGGAVLLVIASILPIPSGGIGGGGGGEGSVVSLSIGLTDPFHFVGYAVLAALATQLTGRALSGLFLAVVGAVVFGFGIELLQTQIPWRTFAWRDVGVNAVGAVVGAAAVAVYEQRRRRPRTRRRSR